MTCPKSKQFIETYMRKAAHRYIDGMQKANLIPSDGLALALAKRALQDADKAYQQAYEEHITEVINLISEKHKQYMKRISKESARMALMVTPLPVLIFTAMSVFFYVKADCIMTILFSFGALAFVAMLLVAFRKAR